MSVAPGRVSTLDVGIPFVSSIPHDAKIRVTPASAVPPPACPARRQEGHHRGRRELGAAYFDRADAKKTATRLIRRLQQIGYAVQATPVIPA
jgi:hypothetical protein